MALHKISYTNNANTSSEDAISNIAFTAKKYTSILSTQTISPAKHHGLPLAFASTATIKMYGYSNKFILCFMKPTCNTQHIIQNLPSSLQFATHLQLQLHCLHKKSNDGSESWRQLIYCYTFHEFPTFPNVSRNNVWNKSSACSTLNCNTWHWIERCYICKHCVQVLLNFQPFFCPNDLRGDAHIAYNLEFVSCWAVRCDSDGLISDSLALMQ